MSALDYAKLARPKDWAKNAFVLMPIPFALAAGGRLDVRAFALAVAGFSLVTSAVYATNDALDAERDRAHEKKRLRPVASGRISRPAAFAYAAALAAAGLGLAALSGVGTALVVIAAYVAKEVLYQAGLKHVPLVDVFLLSSGFVLRVILGAELLGTAPSSWLLLCSSTLALFISLAKRRGELARGMDTVHRPALSGYTTSYLDQAMGVSAGMTMIGYALYCMDAQVLLPGREFASLPFVVFGVLEYLRLAQVRGEGGSPVDLLLRSPALLVCGLGWTCASLWSVGLPI
ncbi:MAG TPA: UbiA prenyltransferase family protein [Myxococcota bacterium]|nr:UbiA prenyltransferase family protein [Myxococcota bacterium]